MRLGPGFLRRCGLNAMPRSVYIIGFVGVARPFGTASYSLRSPNPVPGFGPAGDDRIARPSWRGM